MRNDEFSGRDSVVYAVGNEIASKVILSDIFKLNVRT